MSKYKFKAIKPKSFKGNRLKKIAYAFRGYFPHNYIESDRIIKFEQKIIDVKVYDL